MPVSQYLKRGSRRFCIDCGASGSRRIYSVKITIDHNFILYPYRQNLCSQRNCRILHISRKLRSNFPGTGYEVTRLRGERPPCRSEFIITERHRERSLQPIRNTRTFLESRISRLVSEDCFAIFLFCFFALLFTSESII